MNIPMLNVNRSCSYICVTFSRVLKLILSNFHFAIQVCGNLDPEQGEQEYANIGLSTLD